MKLGENELLEIIHLQQPKEVILVYASGDDFDWEGLYFDGILVSQEERIGSDMFFYRLGRETSVSFRVEVAIDEFVERVVRDYDLPEKFEEVEIY